MTLFMSPLKDVHHLTLPTVFKLIGMALTEGAVIHVD